MRPELVEELAERHRPELRVPARPVEVCLGERPEQVDVRRAPRRELIRKLDGVGGIRDGRALDVRVVAREHLDARQEPADPPREDGLLRVGRMAEAFERRPLPGFGPPRQQLSIDPGRQRLPALTVNPQDRRSFVRSNRAWADSNGD